MAVMDASPRLFRVIVEVADLGRMAEWYGALLGVKGRDVSGGRLYFDCGGVILAVHDPHGAPPRPIPQHLYFAVPDITAVHTRAVALGCLSPAEIHGERAGEIIRRPWGERSFYAVDPFGNGLCFVDERTVFAGQ
jgi:catechol 2,3-dioxygenase-like lactoylglutathione lyase family enzyme